MAKPSKTVELRKLIQKQQETINHYKSLIDQSPDGFLLADLEGNILSVNKTICDRLHYPEGNLLKMNISQILDSGHHERLKQRLSKITKDGLLLEPVEYKLVTKNKTPLFVEVSSTPYLHENKIIGIQSIIRDITRRKKAEDAQKESEQAYRHIFSSMVDALVILDTEGHIIDSNPAAASMYGYSNEELKEKRATDLIKQEYWHVLDEFKKESESNRVFKTETIDLRKDGTEIHVDVRGTKIRRDQKDYFLIILRDVTEIKSHELEREKLIVELKEKVSQINTLSGLLPICASCKNIRDDRGYWNQIEGYIQDHSEAEFSHSLCPECSEKLYGNQPWYRKNKRKK